MNRKTILLVSLITILTLVPAGASLQAQTTPPTQLGPHTPTTNAKDDTTILQDDNGHKFVLDAAQSVSPASATAPEATGGPDAFGYTWDNSEPFNWIDATSGTNTGLSQGSWQVSVTGPIPLGFEFDFYQNTYSSLHISSSGAVGFDPDTLHTYNTAYVPSPPMCQ